MKSTPRAKSYLSLVCQLFVISKVPRNISTMSPDFYKMLTRWRQSPRSAHVDFHPCGMYFSVFCSKCHELIPPENCHEKGAKAQEVIAESLGRRSFFLF